MKSRISLLLALLMVLSLVSPAVYAADAAMTNEEIVAEQMADMYYIEPNSYEIEDNGSITTISRIAYFPSAGAIRFSSVDYTYTSEDYLVCSE